VAGGGRVTRSSGGSQEPQVKDWELLPYKTPQGVVVRAHPPATPDVPPGTAPPQTTIDAISTDDRNPSTTTIPDSVT
jgi:hypothetical protein